MRSSNSVRRLSSAVRMASQRKVRVHEALRASPQSIQRGKKFDKLQKRYITKLDSLINGFRNYAVDYYLPKARREFYEVNGQEALSQIFQVEHRADDYCKYIKDATRDFRNSVVRLMHRSNIDDLENEEGFEEYNLD